MYWRIMRGNPASPAEGQRVPVSGSLTLDHVAAASLRSAVAPFGTAIPTTAHLLLDYFFCASRM